MPILRDNGLLNTPLGANVLNHGAYGEVGPVIAMAVLLGAHGAAGSIILLLVFLAVAMLLTLPAARLRDGSSQLMRIIRTGSDTTGVLRHLRHVDRPASGVQRTLLLILLVILLLLLRGLPVFLVSALTREPGTAQRMFRTRESVQVGLFGATGLTVIVAVTSVAERNGQLSPQSASLLVAAGAITVLLLPMTAILLESGRSQRRPAPALN